jgi:hypothetical protein
MFNLLKRFGKQEAATVELSELESWFEQQAELVEAPLKSRLESLAVRFRTEKESIKRRIETLSAAALKNSKITDKERQFMEGNRSAYIAKVELLCNTIGFPESLADVAESHNNFSDRLEQFAKSTTKPYYVLQQFLANESRDIALSVKSFEKSFAEARKLSEELASHRLDDLRGGISALNSLIDNKASMKSRHEELQSTIVADQEKLDLLKKEEERILQSREHTVLARQKERLSIAGEKLKQKEDELLYEFSVLNHALKKYVKIAYEHEELAGRYAENPLQTLISDLNLEIVAVLAKMREAIERGSIELKDRKKDKTLSAMSRMTSEYFGKFLSAYNQLSVEKRDLEHAVEHSETARKLRDIGMRIRHSQNTLSSRQSKLEANMQKMRQTDIEAVKGKLQDSLQKLVNRPVIIRISGSSPQAQ